MSNTLSGPGRKVAQERHYKDLPDKVPHDIPWKFVPINGVTPSSEGNGGTTSSEGSGGTSSEGSGVGTPSSEGSGGTTSSEGNGGTSSEGSGGTTSSEGSGSETPTSGGSSSGTSSSGVDSEVPSSGGTSGPSDERDNYSQSENTINGEEVPTENTNANDLTTPSSNCELVDGSYELFSGAIFEAQDNHVIYQYEVEADALYEPLGEDDILSIEEMLNQCVLPELFEDCTRRRLEQRKLLVPDGIIGMSGLDFDYLSTTEQCTPYDGDNVCNVVDGQMILWSVIDNDDIQKMQRDFALEAIENCLDSSEFLDSVIEKHPAVQNITFRPFDIDIPGGGREDPANVQPLAERTGMNALPIVVVGSVSAFFIAGIVAYRRRNKDEEEDEEGSEEDLDDSVIDAADIEKEAGIDKPNPALDFDDISATHDQSTALESSFDMSALSGSKTPKSVPPMLPDDPGVSAIGEEDSMDSELLLSK